VRGFPWQFSGHGGKFALEGIRRRSISGELRELFELAFQRQKANIIWSGRWPTSGVTANENINM
jgi:hypothetical protein